MIFFLQLARESIAITITSGEILTQNSDVLTLMTNPSALKTLSCKITLVIFRKMWYNKLTKSLRWLNSTQISLISKNSALTRSTQSSIVPPGLKSLALQVVLNKLFRSIQMEERGMVNTFLLSRVQTQSCKVN